jgi:hypothetical protein
MNTDKKEDATSENKAGLFVIKNKLILEIEDKLVWIKKFIEELETKIVEIELNEIKLN